MKLSRLFLPVGLLAGAATLAFAGPPAQFTIRPPSATKVIQVTASTPINAAATSCATCACCKKSS